AVNAGWKRYAVRRGRARPARPTPFKPIRSESRFSLSGPYEALSALIPSYFVLFFPSRAGLEPAAGRDKMIDHKNISCTLPPKCQADRPPGGRPAARYSHEGT